MRHLHLLTLFVLIPWLLNAQDRTGSITGAVLDQQTLDPLVGATIMLQNTSAGTVTNSNGEYTLSGISSGIYTIIVRYIGYETQYHPDIVIGSNRNTLLDLTLNKEILSGEEVVVSSGYFTRSDPSEISNISFSPEELRRSPGAGQELSRILMATPGVASRGEASQDLMVRGGSSLENGYYIDNIPIPEIRHFEDQAGISYGPTGIVNTELIRSIDFSTGGYSVKYGNHLSSVTDITYQEGDRQQINGDLGLNFAGFTGNVRGPITKDNGSYLFSVRRSYLDIIAEAIDVGGAPSFGDIQGKLVYDIDNKNKMTLLNIYGSSLFNRDYSDAREEGLPHAVRQKNHQNTIGLNWRRVNNHGYSNTSVSYSYINQDQLVRSVSSETTDIEYDHNHNVLAFRNVTYHKISDSSGLEFGADLSYESSGYDYFIGAGVNQGGQHRPDFRRNNNLEGFRGAAFLSYSARPFSRLSATIGTRLSMNSYNSDLNVDVNAQMRYQLGPKLGVTGAFGMYHQTLPGYILSQNDQFKKLPDTRVFHYIAGFDYLLAEDTRLSIEGFQKEYRKAPVLPENNDIGNPSFVLDNAGIFYTDLNHDGSATARGIELLLQKKLAVNFYGMVSASWFHSQYTDYSGKLQRRDYDSRYLFSVIGGYRPNDTWEVSARWSWLGGRPYTPIDVQTSQQAGTEVLDMSRFNSENLPDFHSLFLRIDRRFFFNRTNLVTYIEMWNVYNRENIDGYYWNDDESSIRHGTGFSFLPVGGVKFEF